MSIGISGTPLSDYGKLMQAMPIVSLSRTSICTLYDFLQVLSDAEVDEKRVRELFPDYHRGFNDIVGDETQNYESAGAQGSQTIQVSSKQ